MTRRRPEPKPEQYEEAGNIINQINIGGMDTTLYLASILAERERQITELSDKEEVERIRRVSLETNTEYAFMLDTLVSTQAVLNKCREYLGSTIKLPALCGCEPGGGVDDLDPGFKCAPHAILEAIAIPSEYDTLAKRRIKSLEERIVMQRWDIKKLQENNPAKTAMLDAMAWVWCDGPCPRGIFRRTPEAKLTEELVLLAERNTIRLRRKLYATGGMPYPWYKKIYHWWKWQRSSLRLWWRTL